MKAFAKTVIAGAVILVVGIVIILVALGVNGWQIDGDYEMKTYECQEDNKSLEIDFSLGRLEINYYEGEKIKVEYPEDKSLTASVEETNGKFTFETTSKRKWLNFDWLKKIPATKIWIPQGKIMDLYLEMNAGTVIIADGEYGKFDVNMNAGTISIGDIVCREMSIDMNAGTINMNKITARVKADVDLNAGSVNIQSLFSPIFNCDVNAGSVSVEWLKSGSTKIGLSAGSIDLLMDGSKKNYEISVEKSAGSCNVSNQFASASGGGTRRITADISAGSLSIRFEFDS